MRGAVVVLVAAFAGACSPVAPTPTSNGSPLPTVIPTTVTAMVSCQPYGLPPVPVPFTYESKHVTPTEAEHIGLALYQACLGAAASTMPTSNLPVSTNVQGMPGQLGGPNAGYEVWLIRVDAPIAGQSAQSPIWIEVSKATGAPTVVTIGRD
jgi:hypothetical protein